MRTLLAALLIALALPAAAHAQPYLEAGDAAELAQELADATDEQGICYGWSVQVDDGSGGPSGTDIGSNFGPGRDVRSGDCPKGVVELQAGVTYTCDSCESEDSSDFTVASNVPNGPTKKDLENLDFSGGQLKDDKGDAALASMVGALPLVAASKGLAPPITADTAADPAKPAADHATGSPAIPDWLRENWLALAAFLVLLAAGGVWLASAITADRQRKRNVARAPKLVPAEPDPPQEP